MNNLALRVFWTNSPMPVNQKIANPDIVLNVPFGNVLIVNSGGGAVQQNVEDLDLVAYADKEPATMLLTSDVAQSIEGTNIQGMVRAQDIDASATLSCYFNACIGEFTLTVTESSPLVLFAIREQEPTQACMFADLQTEELIIALVSQGGYIQVILASNQFADNKISLFSATTETNVAIKFKFLALDTLEISIDGLPPQSYKHHQELGKYFQIANYPEMVKVPSITYDLSNAYGSFTFKVPSIVEDGAIYHLTTDAELLGKQLYEDDFIQFYNDKTDFIIIRLPEKVEFPEPIKPVEYFRGKFYDQGDVQNIPDPKAGDYILYSDNSPNLTLFVYDPDISNWKSTVSPSNYRGYYGEISPSIPNSKVGDFIVVQGNGVFAVAFYNPIVGRYVSIKPESTDQITEGVNNLYYSDYKVINRLVSFFAGSNGDSALEIFFDNYVNDLILKKNATYATIFNKNLLELGADNLSPVLTDFVHERNQIEWANVNGWYRISENTPVGTYDIWTHKNTIPDRRYFKLEFNLSFRDNIPAEVHIGLGIHNWNELYVIGGVIAKYDHQAEERFTFWFRRYFTDELVQLKSPTIVVRNETLYFIGMDGNFILGNQNYDRNVLSIFVEKTNIASDILIGGIKLTLLEEVLLPYNQYD